MAASASKASARTTATPTASGPPAPPSKPPPASHQQNLRPTHLRTPAGLWWHRRKHPTMLHDKPLTLAFWRARASRRTPSPNFSTTEDVIILTTPTWLHPPAQGCAARAALELEVNKAPNPNGGCGHSLPHMTFFIPFELMLAQERSQFVLNAHLPMMFFLLGDVLPDRFEAGLTHRKKPRTSPLPCKIGGNSGPWPFNQ